MFYFDKIDGKRVLRSDLIKKADVFFTTKDICICDKSGLKNEQIEKNKKILADYFGLKTENLISPVQTHSKNVSVIKDDISEYQNTDALILTDKNKAVFLNFADCTPLVFYDEKQNIGAVSHAGWKGTAQKIGVLTVEKMVKDFGSNISDISVLIGPAISICCYSVGEEVFEQLKSTVDNFDNLYKKESGQLYVDLKNINRKQLAEIGITKFDICPYCTCCDNEYFYSYRKENATTKRHSAVLKLN